MKNAFLSVALLSLAACSGGEYVAPAGHAATSSPTNAPTGGTTSTPTTAPTGGTTSTPTTAPTGGGTNTPTTAPTATPSPGGATPGPSPTASHGATPTPTPVPVATPTAAPTTYMAVSNNTSSNNLEFLTSANGNTAPISVTSGNICSTCAGVATNPQGTQIFDVEADDKTILNSTAITATTSSSIAAIGAYAVDAAGRIYVADTTNNAVYVLPANANGSVTPTYTIAGSNTPFNDISGIAVDTEGTIYVTNFLDSSVYEYAPGSNGNIAPTAVITGSMTHMSGGNYGLAVNSAGILAVSTQNSGLLEFAPGATGNVAPIRSTGTNLSDADEGVCFDLTNGNVYVVKHDGAVAGFDPTLNAVTFLSGSATEFNNPKNCAISLTKP